MKRLILPILIAISAVAPARADSLADQVKAEAARLLAQVSQAEQAAKAKPGMKPAPLPPALVGDLQRFGLTASQLSVEIDSHGGPVDLRCIFRGMAEETDNQLKAAAAAATGGDQAVALGRLTHMLKDAVEIAPAVGAIAPAQTKAAAIPKGMTAAKCPKPGN